MNMTFFPSDRSYLRIALLICTCKRNLEILCTLLDGKLMLFRSLDIQAFQTWVHYLVSCLESKFSFFYWTLSKSKLNDIFIVPSQNSGFAGVSKLQLQLQQLELSSSSRSAINSMGHLGVWKVVYSEWGPGDKMRVDGTKQGTKFTICQVCGRPCPILLNSIPTLTDKKNLYNTNRELIQSE